MKKKIIQMIAPWREHFSSVEQKKVAFVIKRTVPFSGNTRIFAEVLLFSEKYQLVIFKDGPLDAECLAWRACGVHIYEELSIKALCDVHSAQVVVLGHSGQDAFLTRKKSGRKIIKEGLHNLRRCPADVRQ